jgi:hypothetical protein
MMVESSPKSPSKKKKKAKKEKESKSLLSQHSRQGNDTGTAKAMEKSSST